MSSSKVTCGRSNRRSAGSRRGRQQVDEELQRLGRKAPAYYSSGMRNYLHPLCYRWSFELSLWFPPLSTIKRYAEAKVKVRPVTAKAVHS
ncbi:hypothetical protein AV530_018269 [Patagioenas fasciata monilis]|uniref:Uncharacterized protein n=1 Tax=Patagioenas fasciata monilis TaxID=372326 RepID=A0A1V4JRJ3_PATFA|nr:hypothetical protein AV530_018269 [Patagioenas fasciata monilis]